MTEHEHFANRIVRVFLDSNLSLILIVLATILGFTALWLTPREEDPQIVVPLADIYVNFPGHSVAEVEQLIATPVERILYQIDGVEFVYSMSREDQAIITVRYYVGEDRERSLVKLHKKINENLDKVPAGVTGWVVKPVEIDDVPVATLTLASQSADDMTLRRVAEELAQRLAGIQEVSRAYVVGGRSRVVQVLMDPDRMAGYHVSPLELRRAVQVTNVRQTVGDFRTGDRLIRVDTGELFQDARQLRDLVVGVFNGRPVFLKDVAQVEDGPDETAGYVRHGWGPARGFTKHEYFAGTILGESETIAASSTENDDAQSAVTIAVAKKKGTNAVWVADAVLQQADELQRKFVPSDIEMIVTRNYGLSANDKVNGLLEGLAVAIVIVVALLTIGLGWREAVIGAVAVPVVFGLTLAANLMLGYTINRVRLSALILSLWLLADDPIVDVENIDRPFPL